MSLIVQKYGGTSMGSIEKIASVADRIIKTAAQGYQVVVVVSAMGGETNRLLNLAKSIIEIPSSRELDVLLSTGEQVSMALLSMTLKKKGYKAQSLTGGQAGIYTDNVYGKARIENIDLQRIKAITQNGGIAVVAGFQGVDTTGNITTLGRGGSDTTAVALAVALDAQECQICTDVEGVYTADPRIVHDARKLDHLTYEEMLEMASLGSKVLHIRSVEFAHKYHVKLRVMSTFSEGQGTLITTGEENMEKALISGIAHKRDESKLTITGVPDKPGIAYQILDPIAAMNIEVDMIVQNIGKNNTTDFTFTVHREDYTKTLSLLQSVVNEMGATEVRGDNKIVKISAVGVGMRSHVGIAHKMFKALADGGINIQMISTSEIKISVVVEEKYLELGVRLLHEAFDLDTVPQKAKA